MVDKRRRRIVQAGILGITGLGLGVGLPFFYDEPMIRAPERDGKIIADLHSHPRKDACCTDITDMLTSSGVVGLSAITNGTNAINRGILTYEDAVKFPRVTEIDQGQLAKIERGCQTGYFVRTQEITGGPHHILAVGCPGDYLPNYTDARRAVEEIHARGGVAILNHPYVTPQDGLVKYRWINPAEEEVMGELCEMVDEIEVFNAQCINPLFGILVPNMKQANLAAEALARRQGKKGVAASDTHGEPSQPKIAGIYVDECGLSIDRLKDDLRLGHFEAHKHYVSKASFVAGMF